MVAVSAKKSCPKCHTELDADAQFCPVDGTELIVPDPYIGQVIAGDIQIVSLIGRGAMGSVYRAHQRSVGRDVAVKILHRELSSNSDVVTRFKREAKFASKLSHPHVVEVFLAGQLEDGALYIVMEYLDGESLADTLAREGALPVARALGIALQICDAVGAGHASGVVHRDLKPENVMLVHRADTPDWVKVLDFGIAKGMQGEQSVATANGRIYGTARYISPEAAHGRGVGPPSDVYSIAVILFQMLSGRSPFDAEEMIALIMKHVNELPPALKSVAPGVPDDIARVVMQNLEKDPTKRASDAHVLGTELMEAASRSGVSVHGLGLASRLSRAPAVLKPPTPAASRVPVALDQTLDDVPAVPATAVQPPVAVRVATPQELAPTMPEKTAKRRVSPLRVVVFVVLGLLALFGAGALYTWNAGVREHDDLVAQTQQAFVDHHFTSPPGQNVNDLLAVGLAKWPKDPALSKLRRDAARELATTAMAAHSAGDIEGANKAAKRALTIDPTDTAAKILTAQYEQELATLKGPEDAPSSLPPCVLLTVPQLVKNNTSFDIVAHIYLRAAGQKGTIQRAEVKQLATRDDEGHKVTLTRSGNVFTAHITPKTVGRFYLKFEADVAGELIRAERSIDVTQ